MKLPGRIFLPDLMRTLATMSILAVVSSDSVLACPSCKETVAGVNSGLATGLSYSVLGMVSMPFLLVAIVGGIVYGAYRRAASGRGIDGDGPI